jgi:hypothetical protein
MRVVQGLVGVDVADAGDDGLVEQHGLDRGAGVPGETVTEGGGRERLAQRLGPEPAQERVVAHGSAPARRIQPSRRASL